jgi:hypothetical protein
MGSVMDSRSQIRPAAAALMIPFVIAFATASGATAKPRNLCTPETCGTKTCQYRGKTYSAGDTPVIMVNGKNRIFMCDGFTGKLIYVSGRETSSTDATTTPAPTTLEP